MDNINKNILIVDDNLTICLMLKSWLIKKGFSVDTVTNVPDAKQKVKEQPFDLILSDIRMPEADGFSFLSWVKRYDSDILVIMMTGYADIESAVESMKSGAVDYISKPIEPDQLFKKLDEAFAYHDNSLKQNRFSDDFIKFPGKDYEQLYAKLDHIAESGSHCLILGERGTGKLSVVKYIYEKGIHPSKPLVVFDIEKTAEASSHLTSVSRGGGNQSSLMRKFHEARGGVLYIRQLSRLDTNQQNELINMLTKQTKDEGFTQIIMSTNTDKFRLEARLIPKLYHLIIDDCVVLPTLKGKKEVIIFLANHFLQFANVTLNKQIERIDPSIQEQLVNHDWPENIQELKNCIIKAALLTDGKAIVPTVDAGLFGNVTSKEPRSKLSDPMQGLRKEYYEKEKIMEALELAKGNKTMAASILNIDRKTLYNKIKLYNVLTSN